MLRYVLDRIDHEVAYYKYYPEHDEIPGVVSVNKKNGEATIVMLAPQDKSRIYAFKLMRRLEQFFRQGRYETDGIVAWY